MIKTKDGYAKLIGTTYSGSVSRVLLSNGGDHILGNSNGNISLNNGTVNTNLNADMLDGLHIHAGRNNEANKIVRTDASGYIQAGWINTTSGNIGTGTINKIYCSNDDYIRYKTPANFFETLSNDGNQISITIGSQNRKLTVNYASFTKTLDKVFLPSSTSNAANTAWCKFARITFNNSAWSTVSGYLFFGGCENPDNRAILVYHFRSGNTATTLSAANLYWLVKSYSNAIVIAVKVADNVYDLYTNNSGTYQSPCIYHMSAFSNKFTWSVGNWTTTKPTAAYTSSDIGIVNYANSASNADTLDNYHANGLLTTLSNSNNGISITVGGTTKSISNISVNYANSAGSASFATKVIVNQHTANDTNYPLVWSNQNNTNNVTENQLYKSWSDLYYNPKNKRLTVGGSVVAPSFIKSGGTSQQLLRADGGIATFNWSGQLGQPTWLWGGNNQHSYYVYNPSNFRVAYASSAGNADTVDGYHANSFLIDRGDNYKGLLYDLPCKSIFSGNNLSDAPTTGWVSGIVLGSNWNSNHYQHYLIEANSRWYATRVYSNGKMVNWNTFAYLTDNVASASKWQTARKITLSGSVTGSVSIDGSSNVTVTTTTNHTHNWANIEGKPNTFTPSSHTHSYITIPTCSSLDGNSNNFSVEYAGGNNSVTTKPSGVDAFGVLKLRTAAGWYGQIMMSTNTAPGIYYRNANGLTSSIGWIKLLDSSNSSVSGGGSTWGSSITVNINGTSKILTIPGNPNTDYRVTQSKTTTANYRPLVLGYTNVSTAGSGMTESVTNQVYLSNKFYVQPSTGNLYATTFVGSLSGNASTATSASKWTTARTLTLTGSITGSASIDGSSNVSLSTTTNHSHSWSSITNKPCTLISYSRNNENIDANNWKVKECSFIEIRNAELTYSNLAMNGYNSFFNFWTPDGIACTQFQIGSNAFYYRSKQSGSAIITTNWYKVMDSNNCSVSKSGETLTVKINGTSQSLTNTWRGIQDNLTSSTNTTQSLSAKQGYLLANGSARDNTKLPLSGGTMTGVIKSTFNSNTWINGVTNSVVKGEYTNYGAILSMPVKDGRVSISSYPSNDNYIYFGYATTAYINAGTNNLSKKMYWDAANNKLVADTFQGALQGNATTATTATKLSTSSAGSASLPVYFSNGIPVACTKSSIFSNLSNNGDQLSITVAGYNRLLTVAYASRADSAIDADYASSADWAEDSLHASSADSATNADYATNADTLDGHHAYEFALSGHTHTLKLESSTKNSSMNLVHGGKYELTAGNSSIIFTLPTDITSITFSGGLISSNSNTLTQANHSITIGGQTETAGYSTCNIINNLSINNLSSSSTTNLTAQITVNGVTSAQKTITQLHSRFWDVTRNSTTSNISPGNYSATITEVYGNASGITGNQPTDSWYHVYTAVGQDTKYATQLALGITTDGIWYRKYSNSSWGSWLTVLHSGNIGNYYWANISISSTRNTNTTPQFSKVMINTNTSLYQLNVKGDSHTTGWSRATNGFYCEGNDVYFTHNGTKGEIAVKNNNEFCWGSNSDKLYFNYTAPSNGTTVKNYIWNAGSSSTYASHTTGHITLGNSYYQLKRVGCSVSWSNGRNSAIVRQTTANGYSTVVSSKTTNGSWEMGNYTSNGDSLYFTYISDSNYNSGNNAFSGQIYFNSTGSIYANHFYESSDIRYKKILKNLSINSNTIANLPLFDFEWIENNAIGTGTSAQAVQQILPNLVSGTDKLTLDYGVLGTIAGITACKELVTQKSELQQLKEKVKQLEDKLRKYENI